MKTVTCEPLFAPESVELKFLPEGPYPINDSTFSWVSIQHGGNSKVGGLNVFDFKSKSNKTYLLPGRPGFAFPTSDPVKFVAGCEREVGLFNIETMAWEVLCAGIDSDCDGTIINDAVLYQNSIVFGTKDLEFKTKKASLYLFRMSDRKLIKLAGGQICSNGKIITSDDAGKLRLLDIDTPTQQVASYDLDLAAGKITNRRVIINCKDQPGFPDGMTISPDGQSVFISFYNPDFAPYGQTRQFSLADGSVIASFQTPGAPQNTCPQICKLDGKVYLVITTAIEHMSPDRQLKSPASGNLFIAPLDYAEGIACPHLQLSQ